VNYAFGPDFGKGDLSVRLPGTPHLLRRRRVPFLTSGVMPRALGVCVALVCASPSWRRGRPEQAAPPFDVLIRGGRVLDGTGNPWMLADVAISGDRIASIGRLRGATAAQVIDATGLYVAPGLIDTHTHAGPAWRRRRSAGAASAGQGITTVFINPDGGGRRDRPAARRTAAERPRRQRGAVRTARFGQGGGRRHGDRQADAAEIDRMRDRAPRHGGGRGLSAGPFYAPAATPTPRST